MRGIEQIPWCYDALAALSERGGLGRWRKWLVGGVTGRVLDIGCGTGRNLPLYDTSAFVVGLDPALGSLLAARQKSPQTPLVVGSAEHLPFRHDSFDTVVSGLVFCSVPDPLRGLDEVDRVLAAGGTLRMLEHVRAKSAFGGWLQDQILPMWKLVTGGCHPNRDTERNVEAAGFTIQADRREDGSLRRFTAVPRASPEQTPPRGQERARVIAPLLERWGLGPNAELLFGIWRR